MKNRGSYSIEPSIQEKLEKQLAEEKQTRLGIGGRSINDAINIALRRYIEWVEEERRRIREN